jgi:hypothetical protein
MHLMGIFDRAYTLPMPMFLCLPADTDITTASTYTDPCNHSNEAIMFTWIKRLIITASSTSEQSPDCAC